MYKIFSSSRAEEVYQALNALEEDSAIVSTEFSVAKGQYGILFAVLVNYRNRVAPSRIPPPRRPVDDPTRY